MIADATTMGAEVRDNFLFVTAAALALSGCGSSSSDDQAGSAGQEASQERVITINGGLYSAAAYQGKDENGKTKEEYLIDLVPGILVNVVNAPITSKDSSGDTWEIGMGYSSSPHIVCEQSTPEAKRVVVGLPLMMGATVKGTYTSTYSDVIHLKNCTVEAPRKDSARVESEKTRSSSSESPPEPESSGDAYTSPVPSQAEAGATEAMDAAAAVEAAAREAQ
jgi:hypothetical protein